MVSFEKAFSPQDPQYKKVTDLPEAEREHYEEVVGDNGKEGFITKEAAEYEKLARIAACLNGDENVLETIQEEAELREEERKAVLKTLDGDNPEIQTKEQMKEYIMSQFENFLHDMYVIFQMCGKLPELLEEESLERYRADKDFIRTLIYARNYYFRPTAFLKRASESVQRDKDIVLSSIRLDVSDVPAEIFKIDVVRKEFENDPDVVAELLSRQPSATNIVGKDLKKRLAMFPSRQTA